MRYPEFLKEGGCIGFVAPSFGCVTEPYHTLFCNALDRFSDMGYKTKIGPNALCECGVGISNTPINCAQELRDFYLDEESDILISCGGGELMCEVVSHMDFSAMAQAKPKWYLGYSDNTNFTFLSTTLMDTAALYGPCVSDFGQEPMHQSMEDMLSFLSGKKFSFKQYDKWEKEQKRDEENPLAPYNLTEENHPVTYQYEGPITGRLVGGCLDCLANICGTRFDKVKEFNERYREDGILWFIEACDLNSMSYRRALWELKEAGWFTNAKGFILGRPRLFDDEAFGVDRYEAVKGILGELGLPMIFDVDLGHLPPQLPFVSGAMAEASVLNGEFCISYELN